MRPNERARMPRKGTPGKSVLTQQEAQGGGGLSPASGCQDMRLLLEACPPIGPWEALACPLLRVSQLKAGKVPP